MKPKHTLIVACALMFAASPVFAAEASKAICEPTEKVVADVKRAKGVWTELTPAQWEFVRGIYTMNPLTPPGLPPGKSAAIFTMPGEASGLIFFIDGKRACSPMPAPKALRQLIAQISKDVIPPLEAGQDGDL